MIKTKEEKAVRAVFEYLKTIGWNPAVGNFKQIEKDNSITTDIPNSHFRLIFSFIGSKKKNGS